MICTEYQNFKFSLCCVFLNNFHVFPPLLCSSYKFFLLLWVHSNEDNRKSIVWKQTNHKRNHSDSFKEIQNYGFLFWSFKKGYFICVLLFWEKDEDPFNVFVMKHEFSFDCLNVTIFLLLFGVLLQFAKGRWTERE